MDLFTLAVTALSPQVPKTPVVSQYAISSEFLTGHNLSNFFPISFRLVSGYVEIFKKQDASKST
jgi:hypothetical protein